MGTETVQLTFDLPTVDVETLAFAVTCGQTERWVKHKSLISRLDGPWHYCTSEFHSALAFSTIDEAMREAVKCARLSEYARLLQEAARRHNPPMAP